MHRQIIYHCSFLLIFAVFATRGTDPVITYTCKAQKVTNITVVGVSYDNMKVASNGGNYCERSQNGQPGLLECIQKHVTADKIHLIYEGETNAKLDAGTGVLYYVLSCEQKPLEIKNATATLGKKFGATGAPAWTTLNAQSNSGDPELSISPSTNLIVGQPLTLTMKIPSTDYLISPRECYAHHMGNTDNIKIWQCIKTVVDPNIIDQSVWKLDDLVTDATSVSIPMFAFKFVDSVDLVIECSAMVCKKGTGDASQCTLATCATTNSPIAPVVGRKRRSVTTLDDKMNTTIRHASVSLEVTDLSINKSPGLATAWYAYLVPAYLLICARLYL